MATAAGATYAGVRSACMPIKFASGSCKTVSGTGSATGRVAWLGSTAERKQVDWLPNSNVPLVDSSGRMSQAWYRFFREVADRRLGGIDAATLPDLATTTTAVQDQVLSVSTGVQAVGQQVTAITSTVNTQTEVAQQNKLQGSSQLSKLPSYKQNQIGDGLD